METLDNLPVGVETTVSLRELRERMRELVGDDDSIEAQVKAYRRLFDEYEPVKPMKAYKLLFEGYNLEQQIEAYQILLEDYDVEQRIEACDILLEDFGPKERIEACKVLFKDYESLAHLHLKDRAPMTARKILVVSDDPDMLATIQATLEQGGYNVITAPDGSKGIRVLREELPNLVISDIMMSGVERYEFYKRIQNELKSHAIPFILSTEKGDKESLLRGIMLGIDDYISRPFDTEELLATVKAVLERAEILRRPSDEHKGVSTDKRSLVKKVLIADDHPPIRRAIRALLEKQGYQVIEAPDGVEAVIKTLQYRPDLIFMDIMMPVMDGLEACDKIKAIDDISATPIIMLTAKDQPEDIIDAVHAGAADYVVKPFSRKALIEKVRKHIGRAELGIEVTGAGPTGGES